MQIHDLKIDPQPFADLVSGAKTCEVRNDDRGFEVGDTVRFPGGHCCKISHIQRGYGLPDGLCVLSYAQASAAPEQEPVGFVDEGEEGLFVEFIYGENGNPLQRGDKLYAYAPSHKRLLIEVARELRKPSQVGWEDALAGKIDAFLSATAQPAEVKSLTRDEEEALFVKWANVEYRIDGNTEELNHNHRDVVENRKGWMARAALMTEGQTNE